MGVPSSFSSGSGGSSTVVDNHLEAGKPSPCVMSSRGCK